MKSDRDSNVVRAHIDLGVKVVREVLQEYAEETRQKNTEEEWKLYKAGVYTVLALGVTPIVIMGGKAVYDYIEKFF